MKWKMCTYEMASLISVRAAVLSLLSLVTVVTFSAAQSVGVAVSPETTRTLLYSEFEVDITVNGSAEDLKAFQIRMDFDNTLLDIPSVTEGTLLSSTGPTWFEWHIEDDNVIEITGALLGASLSVDGPGILFRMRLEPIGVGAAPLHFAAVNLRNVHNNDIPSVPTNGNVIAVFEGYDREPPEDPANVCSPSHICGSWCNDNTVDVTWIDAVDKGDSGLDGYSIVWDGSPETEPDTIKDIEQGVEMTTSPPLADGNSHYFHIRPIDNARNCGGTVHIGPFWICNTDSNVAYLYFPSTYSGAPGSHVTIDLYMDNLTSLTESIAGLEATYLFDSGFLTVVDIAPTSRTSTMELIQWNEPESGRLVILISDIDGDVISPGIGPVVQITFFIGHDTCTSDSAHFHFTKAVLSGTSAASIPVRTIDGLLLVDSGNWIAGDADGDGRVDILDALFAVNIILGNIDPTTEQFQAADCNQDGNVNIMDVLGIVNTVLGLGACSPDAGLVKSFSSSAAIRIGDLSVSSGETFDLPVYIETASEVKGVQFIVTYNVDLIKWAMPQLTECSNHITLMSKEKNGKIAVVLFSTEGKSLPVGSEPVLSLRIRGNGFEAKTWSSLYLGQIIIAENCATEVPVDLHRSLLQLDDLLPETCRLNPNYPNPFNPTTSIQYSVVSDQTTPCPPCVTLKIFNLLGQEIRTLVNQVQETGYYTVTWDGRNAAGHEVCSGIYLYQLRAGNVVEKRRMTLLR